MSKDNLPSIHPSVFDRLKGLEDHESVQDEIRMLKENELLDLEIDINKDGFLLVADKGRDLYMLKTPDGEWKQAYIGFNEEYSKEVLEEKYGLHRILDVFYDVYVGVEGGDGNVGIYVHP